jgi:hypothetical protein
MANKTVRKWKKIEKNMYKLLDKEFGLKKYMFFGDMSGGHCTVVITGKERL